MMKQNLHQLFCLRRIPNLLVNGSSGIAVGMATNIPPHNLTEIIDACIALVDNPEISVDEINGNYSWPRFSYCGIINGRAGIIQAYRTGRGVLLFVLKLTLKLMKAMVSKQLLLMNSLSGK